MPLNLEQKGGTMEKKDCSLEDKRYRSGRVLCTDTGCKFCGNGKWLDDPKMEIFNKL
jgi:hypothetical protein